MGVKLSVENLIKSYGPIRAVDGISLNVQEGEIFGLLGPNGAGKTTTIECIIGLRRPDSGSIALCGFDALRQPRQVKQRIGVQLQATALPDKIKLREALRLFASFYQRRADLDHLLNRFSLADRANSRFEHLSGGQRQRLAVALALVNEPEVLLLDEPTAALDPQSRRELHGIVRQMRQEGQTVILTTHYIDEAEQLCDRVAIIDHGKIITQGRPVDLVTQASATPRIVVTTSRPVDSARFRAIAPSAQIQIEGSVTTIATPAVSQTIIDLVRHLQAESNDLIDLHIHKATLEDVFIELTGRRIRD